MSGGQSIGSGAGSPLGTGRTTIRLRSKKSRSNVHVLTGSPIASADGTISRSSNVQQSLMGSFMMPGQGAIAGIGNLTFPFTPLPSLQDERDYYDNVVNWSYTGTNEAFDFASTAPTVEFMLPGSSVHDDTECDDLWNWIQQSRRGHPDTPCLSWIDAWRTWFMRTPDGYLSQVVAGADDDDRGNRDHLYGWGLALYGVLNSDSAAIAMAEAIGDCGIDEFTGGTGIPPTPSNVRLWHRGPARWTILFCYLSACSSNKTKWEFWRDVMLDCWEQTSQWEEAPTNGIVQGGHYFVPRDRIANSNGTTVEYDNGRRYNAAWFYALINEAIWLGWKQTGRAALKDRLKKMARFTEYYAHNPANTDYGGPFNGSYWGHEAGDYYHREPDAGNSVTPPSVLAPTATYDCCPVNTLVRGYKLTGDADLMTRANIHMRQGTRWDETEPQHSGADPLVAEDAVSKFIDTTRHGPTGTDAMVFEWNKGQLQYCYEVFENGGQPEVLEFESGTWTPDYVVPTEDGEIVIIAGDPTGTINLWPEGSGSISYTSEYPTNCMHDVAPTEIGGKFTSAVDYECHWTWLSCWSPGGAIGNAGSGGHASIPHFGGYLFDFTDARHKRIWTTQGNPGVDNVTGLTGSGDGMRLTGTRVHNLLHRTDGYVGGDLIDRYVSSPASSWYPPDWTPTAHSLTRVPLEPDPRDQTWEVCWEEPYPYAPTVTRDAWNNIISGPLGWPYPGEWSGLQTAEYTGLIGDSVGLTVLPKPTTIPLPAHNWDCYFEVTTARGGGPKGSIGVATGRASGASSTAGTSYSHAFDLHTGLWRKLSTNKIYGNTTSGPPPATYRLLTPTAGALDPITERFYVISQRQTSGVMNYLDLADMTWRGVSPGASSPAIDDQTVGRTENCTCDYMRRLLLFHSRMGSQAGQPVRACNLATFQGTPLAGTGGWKVLPVTAVGKTMEELDQWQPTSTPYPNATPFFEALWVFYPPNGKFYRYVLGPSLNDPVGLEPQGAFNTLQRLTPPPYVGDPSDLPLHYYLTEPWTWDEISFDLPVNNTRVGRPTVPNGLMAHGSRYANGSRHPKRLRYVPTLGVLCWAPHDGQSGKDPLTRNPMYLIKPY